MSKAALYVLLIAAAAAIFSHPSCYQIATLALTLEVCLLKVCVEFPSERAHVCPYFPPLDCDRIGVCLRAWIKHVTAYCVVWSLV